MLHASTLGMHDQIGTGFIYHHKCVMFRSFLSSKLVRSLLRPSVYPGSSGGPLVLAETGSIVGFITSFAEFSSSSANEAHPRLAFAVPVHFLEPLWRHMDLAKDSTSTLPPSLGMLSAIEERSDDKELLNLWTLTENDPQLQLALPNAKL